MKNYIDIHSHILPGVDDGSDSTEMSLEMLRMAARDGITQIILTPHNKPWYGHRNCAELSDRAGRLQEKLQEEQLDIKLYTGNELYYRSSLLEELEEGQAETLANSHYVLVEFEPSADYLYIKNGIYALLTGGYYPIMAHPERYKNVCVNTAKVAELIEMGCLMQVNAGSVMGRFGFGAMYQTRKMLKRGQVHFIATDAHDVARRSCRLSECAEYIEKKFGTDRSRSLFHDNPMCVLDNEYIGINI